MFSDYVNGPFLRASLENCHSNRNRGTFRLKIQEGWNQVRVRSGLTINESGPILYLWLQYNVTWQDCWLTSILWCLIRPSQFGLTYSYRPSFPPSLPKPLSLYPPKPAAASNRLWQFTQTAPAFNWIATSSAVKCDNYSWSWLWLDWLQNHGNGNRLYFHS